MGVLLAGLASFAIGMLVLFRAAIRNEENRRAIDLADFRRLGLRRSGEGRVSSCTVEVSEHQVHVRPEIPLPEDLTISGYSGQPHRWLSGDEAFDDCIECAGPTAWLRARMSQSFREHVRRLLLKWPARFIQGNLSIDYFDGARPQGETLFELIADAVGFVEALAAPLEIEPALAEIATSDRVVAVRLRALREMIANAPRGHPHPHVERALHLLLTDSNLDLRLTAAERLGPPAKSTLLVIFDHAKDGPARARALAALAAFLPTGALAEVLGDEGLARRFEAAGGQRLTVAEAIVTELERRENGRLSLVEASEAGALAIHAEAGGLSEPDER